MERITQYGSLAWKNAKGAIRSVEFPWSKQDPYLRIHVVTGDKRGAGTDANVYVVLLDESGKRSRTLKPGCFLRDDHERGDTTFLNVGRESGIALPIVGIEVWRDNFGGFSLGKYANDLFFGGRNRTASDWFLDRIEVECVSCPKDGGGSFVTTEGIELGTRCVFPVHRWIEYGVRYTFPLYDCCLPQDDARSSFRLRELERKKKEYVYQQKVPNGPVQVASLPKDENFSEKFFWTFVQKKMALMATTEYINWTTCPTDSFESLQKIFKKCLHLPQVANYWKEDWWFGLQRLQGANATQLRLCEKLPEGVPPEEVSTILEGNKIIEEIQNKKIFMCDLSILEGLSCREGMEVAAPTALFHLNDQGELLPVAIRLRQGMEDNPIYTPNDDPNTWLMAKMFYNNAEAQHHQSLSHLGLTHLLMEGVCACTHRCLSPSHPVFKLLAPHFLYLLALNKRGEEKLINPGGWVDSTMTQAVDGMVQLMGRGFSQWEFTKFNPLKEIKSRGLLDPKILPCYPYRDDIVDVYEAIWRYVASIVDNYYCSCQTLTDDWELKQWRQEMTAEPPEGIGLKKVPGDGTKGFQSLDELKEVLTGIISTCTLGHAAANSQQYEQYAFVPNYPATLTIDPPKEKKQWTEEELYGLLPSKDILLDVIVITNLLSTPITNKLGDFEVQYLYHPNDVIALQRFSSELKEISEKIEIRNKTRRIKYTDLDPVLLPNSISI